jgi:transcriptional regulator with XRE-family HTH domain
MQNNCLKLSYATGLSWGHISRVLRGYRKASMNTLVAIAKAKGVPVGEVIKGIKEVQAPPIKHRIKRRRRRRVK